MKISTSMKVSLVAVALLFVSVPALSFAAIYAFVNNGGEVSAIVADSPTVALATAPNIDEHSGVILLNNPSDSLVGDRVMVR